MLGILQDQYALFMISDKTHYHLDGYINKQNCRYWAHDNPRELHQQLRHGEKIMVLCALSKVRIIGPFFFDDGGLAVMVNSECYVTIFQDFFIPYLEENEIGHWKHLISTRWCHCTHSEHLNGSHPFNFFLTFGLSKWWHSLAIPVVWSLALRLFPLGVSEIKGLCQQTMNSPSCFKGHN